MPETPTPPTPDEAALLAAVENAVALFGVPMDPAWQPAVLASFGTIAAAARMVAEFPLDDEAEPAPVFRA